MFSFESSMSGDSMPTSILKNLLQNSELFETLLKPIAELKEVKDELSEMDAYAFTLQANEKKMNKSGVYSGFWGPESSSKIFGNSFLDLNPCEKNSTINQTLNNFENIELESLDIDDFLLENGLNGSEAELLEQLTRSETAAQSDPDTSDKALYKNKAPAAITLSDLFFQSKLEPAVIDSADQMASTQSDKFTSPRVTKKSKKSFKIEIKNFKRLIPNNLKDERYWSRRVKNNMAAKRSRDARRLKESQLLMRASFLERENDTLKKQLEHSRNETKALKNKLNDYETKFILIGKK